MLRNCEMNLYQYTYDLVKQIPPGKVSTYGAVAKALGDVRASRAVGRMMNQNPNPDTMPCFKIVYSDGGLGGFGLGIEDKIKRLKDDNIQVKDGKIFHFEQVFFDDFETSYPLKSYREEQISSRSKLQIKDELKESEISTVAGFDVAYPKNDFDRACVACVVVDYKTKKIIETRTVFQNTFFPYIPTYLTFRETPLIQEVYQTLDEEPSVLMFDGNGILHPFQFGLACHAGVLLNKPSIGVAKSLLCGQQQSDNIIFYENNVLGKSLYANKKIRKPVYISPGHLISLSMAYTVSSALSSYKNPKPLREAHILATKKIKSL